MTPSPYAAAIRSTRNRRRRHAMTSATRWTIAAAAIAIAATIAALL